MTKQEFIKKLKLKLARLPKVELNERLNFYSEMIDDGVEEGLTEEEAVAKIGTVEEVALQVINEIPLSKIVKENIKPKNKIGAFGITLIIIGSPIWLSLLIAGFAVILSLYVCVWAVIIALWAVVASFAVCSLASVILGVVSLFSENKLLFPLGVSAGLVLAGLTIFTYHFCILLSKFGFNLIKVIVKSIKKRFIKGDKI